MRTLIKNGTVVTATDQYRGDVLVEDEKIAVIGTSLDIAADTVIDAAAKYVLPGGIDVHTHLDMPFGGSTSADDFETGTRAAAFGGTTSVVDFAIQYRGQTLHHAWETWMKKAEGKAVVDYGFHMIMTDLNDQTEAEMDALVRQGVTSFKLFMAYPGVFMLDDASIFKALLRTAKNGGTICMHAENGGVIDVLVQRALAEGKTAPRYHALTRPVRAEAEATHRAIALAEIADVPIYIVHLSAAEALEMVAEARDRGLPAFAETCPQYLFLSYANYEEPDFDGAKYVMSPPLREKTAQDLLWRGLAFNDLQAISTDPQWSPGHRDQDEPGLRRRRPRGPHLAESIRGADVRLASENLRSLPAQGDHRSRLGCRYRRVRSEPDHHAVGCDAPHERGLQPVRGTSGDRRNRHGAVARSAGH
jgi:dihydropyrimidinase